MRRNLLLIVLAVAVLDLLVEATRDVSVEAVPAPPPPDMVSWWPGDGNAHDILGSNEASAQNGATFGAGMVGQSFNLDGTDDFFSVPDHPSLDLTTGLTIDAWINIDVLDTAEVRTILSKWDHSTGSSYFLGVQNNIGPQLVGEVFQSDGGFEAVTSLPGAVPLDTFVHVAMTFSAGDSLKLYLNGVLVGTEPVDADGLRITTTPVRIGAANAAPFWYFDGFIDEVEIFDRALTDAEVLSIFNADTDGKERACTPAPDGLTSWWPAENNPLDIQDGNDGTLVNGAGFAPGKVDQAFDFDGTDDFVRVPHSANLDPNPSFSVDAWVFWRGNINGSNHEGIVVKRADPGSGLADTYSFFIQASGIIDARISDVSFISTSSVLLNTWSHVALTFDATDAEARIYINGDLDGTLSSAVRTTSSEPLTFGVRHLSGDQGQHPFNGRIDEVELFSREIDALEVRDIADAGVAGKCRATIEVVKETQPPGLAGTFNVSVTGEGELNDYSFSGLQDGDSTGPIVLVPGNYTVEETAGPGTNLGDFVTTFACLDEGGAGGLVASGDGPGPHDLVLAEENSDIVCTFTNSSPDVAADLTIRKSCLSASNGDADFNILVTQLETTLAADMLDCGEVMVLPGLPAGVYTIRELITGPDANDFVSAIVCASEDVQTVTPGTIANVVIEGSASIQCTVLNFFQPATASPTDPDAPTPQPIVIVPIDIANTNTNALNNHNVNDNSNENTNTQSQSNQQEQTNDNNQGTNVISDPSVVVDFDD